MCKCPSDMRQFTGCPSNHGSKCVKIELSGESCCRVNITLGPKEERLLMTGLHTVADIYCTCCSTVLGWKYVRMRIKLHYILLDFPQVERRLTWT